MACLKFVVDAHIWVFRMMSCYKPFVPFADTVLFSDETGITLSDKWTTDNVITTNIAVEDQVCFK